MKVEETITGRISNEGPQPQYNVLGHELNENKLAEAINELAGDISVWAQNKGFWDSPHALQALCAADTNVARFVETLRKSQKGYLMMSELGEHCEALRGVDGKHEHDPDQFTGDVIELADLVIRVLDYCGYYELPIGEAIIAKMAKNQKRPHLHGKKF